MQHRCVRRVVFRADFSKTVSPPEFNRTQLQRAGNASSTVLRLNASEANMQLAGHRWLAPQTTHTDKLLSVQSQNTAVIQCIAGLDFIGDEPLVGEDAE